MAKTVCVKCGKKSGFTSGFFIEIDGEDYCSSCAKDYKNEAIASIIATTTNNIDGYKVTKYIDIDSVEIVIGTGAFSEFGGEISDFFGARSTSFEKKMQKAKKAAIEKLKLNAFERKADAIIGIDLDYTEFAGNRIGIIANGTFVNIEKI